MPLLAAPSVNAELRSKLLAETFTSSFAAVARASLLTNASAPPAKVVRNAPSVVGKSLESVKPVT